MGLSRKIFQKTGYFLQEIARSKIILQAVMVGLISGVLVVFFKVSISKLFEFKSQIINFPFNNDFGRINFRCFGV